MEVDSNMDDLVTQIPPFNTIESGGDELFPTLSTRDSEVMTNFPNDLMGPGFVQDFQNFNDFGSQFQQSAGRRSCCMHTAIELLRTLYTMPSMCFSTGSHSSPGTDHKEQRTTGHVLSTNREVVHSAMKMLDCECFTNLHVQIILSTLCYKLIVWYRAIINSAQNMSTWPEEMSENILHQPITLGDYTVDHEMQSQLRLQVVSSELQRFETLLQEFLKRLDILPNDGGRQGLGTTVSPSNSEQRQCLKSFLNEQFLSTKTEISALAGSGNP